MKYNTRGDRLFEAVVYILLTIFSLVMLYPLIYIVSSSFSDPMQVYLGKVWLLPKGFSLEAYIRVFKDPHILTGYLNTLYYTGLGTVLSIVLTFTAAYPLSRKDLAGRKPILFLYTLTMFINGGLIPTYMIVDQLRLTDTIWGFIIPGCLSVWNIIVVRTFISSTIPWELQEAAMIDGSSNWRLFFQIVLPLCKPIIAVMVLFYSVGYWNSYFNALIYLTDEKLYPLQMFLRNILIGSQMDSMMGGGSGVMESVAQQGQLAESLKYATIVVSSAPILCLYPFLQKYFVKGIMVGSLKG